VQCYLALKLKRALHRFTIEQDLFYIETWTEETEAYITTPAVPRIEKKKKKFVFRRAPDNT